MISTGIVGKKIGMTQVFAADGRQIPVTVIEAGPCPVLIVKDKCLQVAFDATDEKKLSKARAGHFKKFQSTAHKLIREVRRDPAAEYKAGDTLTVEYFKDGDFVDITGTSLGKGFQGGMKRWHWQGGPASHGSTSHRRVGSMGSSTTPGRVWRGHHEPGHMGDIRVTVQNLRVVKVDIENNLLLVRGAVPGFKNGYLLIHKAKKKAPRPTIEAGAQPAAKK